jgi:hypothetical protein
MQPVTVSNGGAPRLIMSREPSYRGTWLNYSLWRRIRRGHRSLMLSRAVSPSLYYGRGLHPSTCKFK